MKASSIWARTRNIYVASGVLFAALAAGAPQKVRPIFVDAPSSPIAVGESPVDVALGDLNNDGNLDFVTANQAGSNVSVMLGNGRGNFRKAPGSPLDAGPKPHLVVLGDVNNDGRLDLAVTEHDSNDVRVFLGNGHGQFTRASGSPFAALQSSNPHNHGLAFGDFNNDGNADLATSNQNDHTVSVLLGDGKANFSPAGKSPFAVGRAPYPLVLGDVNGDGRLDSVTPNVGGNSLSILLGDGNGGFSGAPGSPLRVLNRPYFVDLGDINGDGKIDMVVAHDDVSFVTVLLGEGNGAFRQAAGSPLDLRLRAGEVLLHDLNKDGMLDIVAAAGDHVLVYLGNGRGGFSAAPGSPFATRGHSWAIAVGDVNRDGKPDMLATQLQHNSVLLLLGN